MRTFCILVLATSFSAFCATRDAAADSLMTDDAPLQMPAPGSSQLRVLSTNLLELALVNTKAPDPAPPENWNLVDTNFQFQAPALGTFEVMVDGLPVTVSGVGFKRRPLYAPLVRRDLRIANFLYLQLASPIREAGPAQTVEVRNPGGQLWTTNLQFIATTDPLRYSPAIHVNQEGYVPGFPKKAKVGYYLGSLGEMPVPAASFQLVDTRTGTAVYQGTLRRRPDVGYLYSPTPYQEVYEADFSDFTNSGEYRLAVPGLGASGPFRVDEGVAMSFARTYALGLYHQRCGDSNALPFTRFTHGVCHHAPADVPSPQSAFPFTWYALGVYGALQDTNHPPQLAPRLTNEAAQLYPFVRKGKIDVAGGHHDAGDYSKYTMNSAALIHCLVFAVDAFPGVAEMDNLGLPESGDGKSDLLQEAKWEADFLAKLQDTDGGFYFLVYPHDREYEFNVLPDQGDPQVVWPKTTSVTAAAVAALAQCASSPQFQQQFPTAAAHYLQRAQLGWSFLTNAIARHSKAGAYQRITHYGDEFTHNDELAWAACEMFLATGSPYYHQQLLELFPNPNDPATWRWSWWHMYESYGNAIRSYGFAARSSRVPASLLDSTYLARCEVEIAAAAHDATTWSQENAYATSFARRDKEGRVAAWYFSNDRAFDLTVAYQLDPRPEYAYAILGNLDYEGGCNPVNLCYLTGLGWKRQREIAHQYAQNDRRVLPPSGFPIGNIQGGFQQVNNYGPELDRLTFPYDNLVAAPYPYYDRWADTYNVSTEFVSLHQARALASVGFLAALTSFRTQSWKSAAAEITGAPAEVSTNTPITALLQVSGLDLAGARIIWEGRDQEPAFGTNQFLYVPTSHGPQWIEAEAQWPDGRRAFAVTSFFATNGLSFVSVVATATNMTEGVAVPGQFTFFRKDNTNTDLIVNFQFSSTATKFIDYRRPQGDMPEFVMIPAGATSAVLTIVPVIDTEVEGRETITLTILSNGAYNVVAPNVAALTISDWVYITSIVQSPEGGVTLTWASAPGFLYRVLCKDDLSEATWTDVSGGLLASSSSTSWTDEAVAGAAGRFYTVRMETAVNPQILSLVPAPGGGMTLTWRSVPGGFYRVAYKDQLTDANWTDLSGTITAISTTASWTDPAAPHSTQRFYAVRALN